MKQDTSVTWRNADAVELDLEGKTVAVIGGTGGVGRAIGRVMAARGARVIVVGRTFRDAGTPGIDFIEADLRLMREADRVAERLPAETLDLVVFTAGVMAGPRRAVTREGLEQDMAVSYLSRLLILRKIGTRLGAGRPRSAPRPRVFVMGAPGAGQGGVLGDLNAEQTYRRSEVHANTVAGNEMLVLDAVVRYPNISVFGLNPGLVKSGVRAHLFGGRTILYRLVEAMIGLAGSTAETYAARIVPLLLSPELEGRNGVMFDRKGRAMRALARLQDPRYRLAFLNASEALVVRALLAPRPDVP